MNKSLNEVSVHNIKRLCLFRRLGLNSLIYVGYFYDVFWYFLISESFGCIDFQWMDVNDEKVMNTVICGSNTDLEWHKDEKISFGRTIPLKLPRLASWDLPRYNLYSTRDSKLLIVFLYHLFTVVVLTGISCNPILDCRSVLTTGKMI